jgi:hypothetical protein
VSWPRTAWTEAIWASTLQPSEKLTALAFADHARNKRQAWVSYQRLMERTGYSRDTCARSLRTLRECGWLTVVSQGRQHHATVYELTKPAASSPTIGLLDASQQSDGAASSSPMSRTPPKDIPMGANGKYRGATAQAQRRESTSPVASAAYSPGELAATAATHELETT